MFKGPSLPTLLILLFVTVCVSLAFWSFEFDDGYIVYRVAENISSGKGWVYNPGQKTNSSTSVLWTLILSAGIFFSVPPGTLAHLLGALSLGLSALVLRDLLRSFVGEIASLTGSLILLTQPLLLTAFGLETHLCLLLALLCVWAYREERWNLAGILGGLLVLTRPDGVLVLAVLLADGLFRWRRILWKLVLVPALLLAPWAAFSTYYFGSPLPNTLAAKMAQGRSGLWSPFLPWPLSYLPLFFKGFLQWWRRVYSIPLLVATAILIAAGLRRRIIGHAALLAVAVWGGIHLLAYSFLKVPAYHWYYMPLVAAFAVAVAVGFGQTLASGNKVIRWAGWLCVSLLLITQLKSDYSFYGSLPEPRHEAYRKVSDWLIQNTDPQESVALAEIGTVGYYSKRPIVDMAGVVDASGPVSLAEGRFDWWLSREPSIVILHEPAWVLEKALLENPRATRAYRLVASIRQDGYGVLHIWERTSR